MKMEINSFAQNYKSSRIVNYDTRVIATRKLPLKL